VPAQAQASEVETETLLPRLGVAAPSLSAQLREDDEVTFVRRERREGTEPRVAAARDKAGFHSFGRGSMSAALCEEATRLFSSGTSEDEAYERTAAEKA